jgi:hypothetical protein
LLTIALNVLLLIGQHDFTDTLVTKAEHYEVDPTLAASIIYCESRGNPQVIHTNKNGSKDTGLFQINDIHTKEAIRYGDNLMTVEGNLNFGMRLMAKEGIRPWSASHHCWKKLVNPNWDYYN